VAVALGGGHLRFQLSVARQQLLDLLVLLLDQGLQFGDSVFHAHASMLHRCTSPPDLLPRR
jgi:ABC-type polysaccharide/polyol phosphate transport system ATPase subunit